MVEGEDEDEELRELKREIGNGEETMHPDESLRYKGRIHVPEKSELRTKMMDDAFRSTKDVPEYE